MRADAEALAAARRGAEGTAVILSANPIHDTGGGQRSAQLALELLEREWAVVFVSHGRVTETVDLGLRYDQPRLVQWSLSQAVRPETRGALLEALTGGDGLVITQVPVAEWLPLVEEATGRGVPTVYDCIDRWASELGRGWYDRSVEAVVARASTFLVASAPTLVDHVEELTRRAVRLLPNAYNGRIFDADRHPALPRPHVFPDGGRVALYVGALWGGWMDWALVRSAAEALPETTFVFVGDHRGEGRRLPDNCVFTGLLPQTELPQYLAHADVAFLPWRANEVTDATSPLKVFEFVAMGLPVVAPEIEPLRGLPGVQLEGPAEAFVRTLRSLDRGSLTESQIREMRHFAAGSSWERRVDDLLEMVGWPGTGRAEDALTGTGHRRAVSIHAGRASISVAIPAYNHERFIGQALESVQHQTLGPGEVVVVDDGSSDGTASVVEEWTPRGVRLIRQQNRGAHHALNRAVRLATGDWIAVLNSDDAWEPERLEHAWAVARETGAALVVGTVRLVDHEGGEVDASHEIARWYREARAWAEGRSSLRTILQRHNIAVTTSNFFFHRSLWESLGGFRDYRYVHDYDFILRAVELCPRRVVYEPALGGVLYRIHAANTITDGGTAQCERKELLASLRRPLGRARRLLSAWGERRRLGSVVDGAPALVPVANAFGPAENAPSEGGASLEGGALLEGGASSEGGRARRVAPRVGPRPRVGFIVDSLGLGGLEEVVALLAQSLPAWGVDTAVACVSEGGAVARRLVQAGIDVRTFRGDVTALARWASDRQLVAANSHFAPVEAVQALAGAGISVVETVQNCYAWLDADGWSAERRRVEAAAGVVAVSETVAAYYARRCGREADWTVPNAVHPARAAAPPRIFARRALGLPRDAVVLAFVGRITEQKNPAGLVAAFAAALAQMPGGSGEGLSKSAPDCVLVLAGPADGSARMPALRRRHAHLFAGGQVRHLPEVRHVGTVLAAADVYVSNAFYEGWSVAASEAAWVGRPLVLSETGGSQGLVGAAEEWTFGDEARVAGERGFLVPNACGDPLGVDATTIARQPARGVNEAAMAAAMVEVVAGLPTWQGRAAEIRAWARSEVSPEVMARRYAEILTGVAERRNG